MAQVRITASELRPGDWQLDADGGHAYRIEKVWRATAGEARMWKADGLQRGDICADVTWNDGGTGQRFYSPHHMATIDRD